MNHIMMEVCAACQNNCPSCAHSGMMSTYKGYQLSIDELERFIRCTVESGYSFETVHVHGMGEPLLWRHFNTGMRLLRESGIAGNIVVTSNGLAVSRIEEETWEYFDALNISVYENTSNRDVLTDLAARYPGKINFETLAGFRSKPTKTYRNKIPCRCLCSGPMLVKDRIFLYCGPPAFDAATLAGIDILRSSELQVDLAPGYLRGFDESKIGNIELCNSCWANDNIDLPRYPHGHIPSRFVNGLKCWFLNEFQGAVGKLGKISAQSGR